MYKLKRICSIIWVCLAFFSTAADYNPANSQLPDLVILSTNDRHSSFLGEPYPGYDPTNTGDGSSNNPIGPPWRRIWDIAEH